MNPAILSALATLILVGGPFFLGVLYLGHARRVLAWQLDESQLRERTQRSRAVAAEQEVSRLRLRVASLARRVARAEGWDPDASPLIEGQEPPASRPASPPPESSSRA